MVEVDDLNGTREVQISEIPDPDCAVSQHDELFGTATAASNRLGEDAPAELLGGLDGTDVAGGSLVADGAAPLVEAGLGEDAAELGLTSLGLARFILAGTVMGLARHHWDTGAIDDHVHLRHGVDQDDLAREGGLALHS